MTPSTCSGSTHSQITVEELPSLFKLASTQCSHTHTHKKKAMFGEPGSRRADDQSASPSVYHSLSASLCDTCTHTNNHTVLWSSEQEEEAALEGDN